MVQVRKGLDARQG